MDLEELARLILLSLKRSNAVEIDGLGTFARSGSGDIRLRGSNRPRVFIGYAAEDGALAERLFRDLKDRGFEPWMDRRKLLPGQNWPRRIEDAIASSDFFIGCFSKNSVRKRGGFQAEIRYALDCAKRIPLDDVFLIPVRLDDCRVPTKIQRETHYIDLFPEWVDGLESILRILDAHQRLAA